MATATTTPNTTTKSSTTTTFTTSATLTTSPAYSTSFASTNDSEIWTYVGTWSACSVTCGHGGVRQRTQICDGGSCLLNERKFAVESCNAAESCFVLVRNNSTMMFEIIIDLTYESITRQSLLDAISSALDDISNRMNTTVHALSIVFNTRRRRDGDQPSDRVSVTAMFTMEKLVEKSYVKLKIFYLSNYNIILAGSRG